MTTVYSQSTHHTAPYAMAFSAPSNPANAPATSPSAQMNAEELGRLLLESTHAPPADQVPLMIWGAPGIGKSDLVRETAEDTGWPLIDLRLSQLEPTDLRGLPIHVDDRVRWVPPEELPDAARDGERGILFLDEINAAPPAVSAAAYQLILDRRLGQYRLPDGWLIVAAGNRLDDRGITYAMPAPLANRFMHVELRTDVDIWLSWARRNDIHPRITDFIDAEPHWLSHFDPQDDIAAFASPRSWVFAHRILSRRERDDADSLRQVAACVGPEAAAALARYEQTHHGLQDWLDDPVALGEVTELGRQIAITQDIQDAVATQRIRLDQALVLARHIADDRMAFGLIEQLHQTIGDRLFDEPEFSDWVAARGNNMPLGSGDTQAGTGFG